LPTPANLSALIIFDQTHLPQLQKDAGFGPLLEPPVSGGTGTDACGVQGVPLTTRPQHEEDGIHGLAGFDRRVMTAQRMRLAGR
jgi:hypothetical protein